MKMEPVTDARKATLFLIGRVSRPFIPYIAVKHTERTYEPSNVTCLFEDEAPNLAIPFATRPYNENITGFDSEQTDLHEKG